jgi:hypothetical protein
VPPSDRSADLAGTAYFFYGRPDAGWGRDFSREATIPASSHWAPGR